MASKYSTSESEHTETPPAKRKCLVYNQKYLKKWESDPKFSGWISKSDKGPMYYFCKACGKDGKAGKSELEKHAMGMKHISNVEARQKTVSVLSMPAFSGKSRQEKQVKESEIRLAAYISEHNAPFTSMEHLVPLIQAVCPDSEIAKKLKIQSIKAVSWCEFFFLSNFASVDCRLSYRGCFITAKILIVVDICGHIHKNTLKCSILTLNKKGKLCI